MQAHRKAAAFARTHKKHLIAAHLTAAAVGLLVAFLVGAFAAAGVIWGVHLTPKGVQIYKQIEKKGGIERRGHAGEVKLTPAQLAKLKASAAAAAKQLHPNVQATPQPKLLVQPLPRNYSARIAGSRYLLLVAHDTESPNAPGIQDLEAIRAWFSNPSAQASANYVDDAQGNTLELVNPATFKAWHVAYFNPWAIGVEEVGYASQTKWPLAQVEATARIFAHWATKYGIPIQRGKVSGCTILRPGIVFHADLGLCGGGHHDPGLHYPIGLLIRLTRMYAHASAPPKPIPAPKPKAKVVVPSVTLQLGAHGAAVKLLQKALNEHGARLAVDGSFGAATQAAVVHFQKTHRLAADGIVGAKTRAALNH